jgi:hypothetical protein
MFRISAFNIGNVADAYVLHALKFVCRIICAVTVVTSSSASPQESSVPYSNGGFSRSFGELARQINRSGKLFRIEGRCRSACTMFLSLRSVCVDQDATLLFHSGRPGTTRGRERMLATYNAKLRDFLITNHYMDTPKFHAISGRDIVRKFGYSVCPPDASIDGHF